MSRNDALNRAAQDFQRAMLKSGLGVSIKVGDRKETVVTRYCHACKKTSAGAEPRCAYCGEPWGHAGQEEM